MPHIVLINPIDANSIGDKKPQSNLKTRKKLTNEFSDINIFINHLVDVCGAKVLAVDWAKEDLTPGESFVFCENFVLVSSRHTLGDTGSKQPQSSASIDKIDTSQSAFKEAAPRESAINENTTTVLQDSGFIVHKFSPASCFNAMDCAVNMVRKVVYVGCSMAPFAYKSEYPSAGGRTPL